MDVRAQAGFTVLEAAITVAIIAIAVGGIVAALAAFGKYGAAQAGPNRSLAQDVAAQITRVAADAWKYGADPSTGLTSVPSGTQQLDAPLPQPGATATSLPLTIGVTLQPIAPADAVDPTRASAKLSVSVGYPQDLGHDETGTVTSSTTLQEKAPIPGSVIAPSGTVAAPTNAP